MAGRGEDDARRVTSGAEEQPSPRLVRSLLRHAAALLGRWLRRAQAEGLLRFDHDDGLRLWPEEIARLFVAHDKAMHGLNELTLPPSDAAALRQAEWRVFRSELEANLGEAAEPAAERWQELLGRYRLAPEEGQLLALLVILQVDHALLRAYRFGWGDFRSDAPSWGFACKLLSLPGDPGPAWRLLEPSRSRLFTLGLVRLVPPRPGAPLAEHSLSVEAELARWLLGDPLSVAEWRPFESLPPPPKRLREALRARVRRCLGLAAPLRVSITGPQGSGRLSLAAQLAQGARCRGGLWLVDLGRAAAHGRLADELARALRMGSVLDAAVVLTNAERLEGGELRLGIERAEAALASLETPLVWVFEAEKPAYLALRPEAVLATSYPTRDERQELWAEALGARIEPASLEQLAGQFLLSEGQIARVVREVTALPSAGPRELAEALAFAARQASQLGLGKLATPEHGRVAMSQLVVADETSTALQELIVYAQHRMQLAEDWGFAESMPYGLGVTALFTGPSGTGKTFAAQALATALRLELYRVDLSQLVSKYIGETEKHLAELFTAAEQGEVLLLFDEADSVFGKRTEVKTSVDRYANLEVNYLLQRIERFAGVTILTTNFEAGIDEAFARRIRFRVPFDPPDERARAVLWRKLLPAAVPVADDVDFALLAHHFELCGGNIKEVVLRAASLAMTTQPQRLTQSLLLRSCLVEYKKLGKLPPQELEHEDADEPDAQDALD